MIKGASCVTGFSEKLDKEAMQKEALLGAIKTVGTLGLNSLKGAGKHIMSPAGRDAIKNTVTSAIDYVKNTPVKEQLVSAKDWLKRGLSKPDLAREGKMFNLAKSEASIGNMNAAQNAFDMALKNSAKKLAPNAVVGSAALYAANKMLDDGNQKTAMINGASCVPGLGNLFEKNAMVKEALLPLLPMIAGTVGRGLLSAAGRGLAQGATGLLRGAGRAATQLGSKAIGASKNLAPAMQNTMQAMSTPGGAMNAASNGAKAVWNGTKNAFNWQGKQMGTAWRGMKDTYKGIRSGNAAQVQKGVGRMVSGGGKLYAADKAIDMGIDTLAPSYKNRTTAMEQMYLR